MANVTCRRQINTSTDAVAVYRSNCWLGTLLDCRKCILHGLDDIPLGEGMYACTCMFYLQVQSAVEAQQLHLSIILREQNYTKILHI
eukprot:m.351504 g.351504  ORF g.351504 m.351504 type:complete len:87 (+) comp20702_c0_seq4:1456-1716(+)